MNVSGIKAYNISSYNNQPKATEAQSPQVQHSDVAFQGVGRRVAGAAAALLAAATLTWGGFRAGTVYQSSKAPSGNIDAIGSVSDTLIPQSVKKDSLMDIAGYYFENVKTSVDGDALTLNAKYGQNVIAPWAMSNITIKLAPSEEEDSNSLVGTMNVQIPDYDSAWGFNIPGTDTRVSLPPFSSSLENIGIEIKPVADEEPNSSAFIKRPDSTLENSDYSIILTIDGQKYTYSTSARGGETYITSSNGEITPLSEASNNWQFDPFLALAVGALTGTIVWGVKTAATGEKKSKED